MSKQWICAMAAALALAPVAQAMVIVDDFNTDQNFSTSTVPGLALVSGDMLFGKRLTSGPGGRFYGATAKVSGGVLDYSAGGLSYSQLNLTYASNLLTTDAPVPVDLTEGGINDRLVIRIEPDSATRLTVTLSSGAESASHTFALAASGSWIDLSLPFADFIPAGSLLASSVTQVSLSFVGPTDTSYATAGRVDFVRAVPEPSTMQLLMIGLLGSAAAATARSRKD